MKDEDLPKYVLISDFATFRLYDLETGKEFEFLIEELPDKTSLFGFIYGAEKREYKEQDPVNIKVAEKLGELHDALEETKYTGHKLEVFLVRLVYCLFADNTGIFQPVGSLLYLLEERTNENSSNLRGFFGDLFQILDTPETERQSNLDDDLKLFPYVNGELFSERLDLPFFNKKMRQIVIEACSMDWSKVSPAIFGSLFQSVMNPQERRNLSAHYTSEQNIMKVIQGLFLDELYERLAAIKNNVSKLNEFHDKISKLKFFDPACGCGNFLVITYRELRKLELEILKQIRSLTGNVQLELDTSKLSKIDVDSFYGIEYEEFPAEIARVALWLTDHQANQRLSAEFGLNYVRLPLVKSANILHENALRVDWNELVEREGNQFETNLYILGNPPFVGGKMMDKTQREDIARVAKDVSNYGLLDYVCAWYVKAVKFIQNTKIKVAFVSTNSITQGEQVSVLWQYLLDNGVKIHFAHRTFKWTNEARGKAAVYCVIVGFAVFDTKEKRLFDYETPISEAQEIQVKNINPYLIDYDDLIISRRQNPLSNVSEMNFGNMALDGGNLIISSLEEKEEIIGKNPQSEKFIKKLIGAREFVNNEMRWCLWFLDAKPQELNSLSNEIKSRIKAVKEFRENSKAPSTRKFADTPYLFRDRNLPKQYLLIPRVTSEKRLFIPIGFFKDDTVPADSCLVVPDATLYHFGVLTSLMHNAWMRQVCGRLKSDYRYSKNVVYNNFPFPKSPTETQTNRVEQTAQAILDAREIYQDSTLADLYNPLSMPKELVDAHRANDKAIDACYGKKKFKNEIERLEFLFDLYRQYTNPIGVVEAIETKKSKRRRKV
ncbi:MAG: class I SAM-dependent DNA methyltransferase [Aridibacter sp.]